MGSLTGKTAVVLGASGASNFGTAIARRLATEGANVVVSGRRKAPLDKLAAEIDGLACPCDITDEAQIEKLFNSASERFPRLLTSECTNFARASGSSRSISFSMDSVLFIEVITLV